MESKPTLKMAVWNAGGRINNKKEEIQLFLSEHNIDIMLLSETLLKAHQKFKIPGYKTYKNRRTTHNAELLFLSKKTSPIMNIHLIFKMLKLQTLKSRLAASRLVLFLYTTLPVLLF